MIITDFNIDSAPEGEVSFDGKDFRNLTEFLKWNSTNNQGRIVIRQHCLTPMYGLLNGSAKVTWRYSAYRGLIKEDADKYGIQPPPNVA